MTLKHEIQRIRNDINALHAKVCEGRYTHNVNVIRIEEVERLKEAVSALKYSLQSLLPTE